MRAVGGRARMQIVHDGAREPMHGQGEMLLAMQEEGMTPVGMQ
jgi:hypothetical protein